MAKYNVKFSCGHEETVELFGKDVDRHRKIEYFEEHGMCSECYKKQQAEKMEKEYDIVEMLYSEYKNKYDENKTVADSYNKETKTIKVYVKKEVAEVVEVVEEIELTDDMTANEMFEALDFKVEEYTIAEEIAIKYVRETKDAEYSIIFWEGLFRQVIGEVIYKKREGRHKMEFNPNETKAIYKQLEEFGWEVEKKEAM